MPAKNITTSSNISVLDFRVDADLCEGKFYIDASPSVYIGSGASNVLGIKVKVTDPFGTIIKDYSGSYDIDPDSNIPVQVTVPTKSGKYKYGVYQFDIELFDAGGTTYPLNKPLNVCKFPDVDKNCGNSVAMVADCQEGKLYVTIANPPVYQGKIAEDVSADWTLIYPSGTLANEDFTSQNFVVALFEGVYKLNGSYCATYNMGDNLYIKVPYTVTNFEKNVKCILDYTCIVPVIKSWQDVLSGNCSEKVRMETSDKLFEAIMLIQTINMMLAVGEDASEKIADLELLLGKSCTCDCTLGTPISNNSSSALIQIEGCGVETSQQGLVTVYTIDNYEYRVQIHTDSQSILSITSPSITDCVKTQTISINLSAVYSAVISQINSPTYYNQWAQFVNETLVHVDPTELGIDQEDWDAMSLYLKFQAIVDAIGDTTCGAEVDSHTTSRDGGGVSVEWVTTNAYGVDIYVDNILKARVLSPVDEYTVPSMTDGSTHTYKLYPFCSNGMYGTPVSGTFGYTSCPSIAPPSLSQSTVSGATCPYDLTALVGSLPAGITAEWHNAANTEPSSLVGDPENVASGVYYVYGKDAAGCYSNSPSQVTIVCSSSSCTAPQSPEVSNFPGGSMVRFLSASAPPVGGYTVKRRLASAADLPGNYTTIGTPIFNSSTSKWEILDTTRVINTVYVYRVESECTGDNPYVDYTFAYVICPTINFTELDTSVLYNFLALSTGTTVDKYVVELYANNQVDLISSNEHTLPHSTTEVDDFIYLDPGTTYQVRMKIHLQGGHVETCGWQDFTTTSSGSSTIEYSYNEISGGDGSLIINRNGSPEVTETDPVISDTFTAAHGDLIEIGVIGSNSFIKRLTVTNTTTSAVLYDDEDTDNRTFSFNAEASNDYLIEAEIEDVS